MALVQITAIHPLFFSLILFYLDQVASRPTHDPAERIQGTRIGQVQESLDAGGGTALSVNDKLAISLSIGVGALVLIFGIVCFIGYNKRRRSPLQQNNSNDNAPESMQKLPHHPLYKECLHSTNTNTAINSPNTANTLESSPFLYNPYIPSPIAPYFQPADVYRTLRNANDANGVTERPRYLSPPPDNPLILNPTGPRVSQSFSEPQSPKTIPKPKEDAVDPVTRSTTIPIYSPQPRRGIGGLSFGAHQRLEAGLGVTYPPQAMIRERPL